MKLIKKIQQRLCLEVHDPVLVFRLRTRRSSRPLVQINTVFILVGFTTAELNSLWGQNVTCLFVSFFFLPYIKWSDPNTEQSLVQSLKSQANTLVQQVTDTVTNVLNLFVNDRSVWREMPLFCLSHSAVHISGSTERKNMSTLWIHKGKRKLKSCLSWNGHRLWWNIF